MINFPNFEAVQAIRNFKWRKKSVKKRVKMINHGITSKNKNRNRNNRDNRDNRIKTIMIMIMTAWNVIILNNQSYQFVHSK